MNREQFIAYAREVLDDMALESLHDTITQHNSEVAMFGDSWPGAMLNIQYSIDQVRGVERQLARLEGREPRDFHFRVSSPR